MKYRQEKKSIQRALNHIDKLSVSNDTPFDFLRWIKTINKTLETMKLGVSDIDLVDEYEPILHYLRIRLTDLEVYYRLPDSEIRKKEILELLDHQLAKFKDIKKVKREIDGLKKQDKEIDLAEETIVIAKESNVIAKESKKIAFWAIVIACLGTILGMGLTVFLHFR